MDRRDWIGAVKGDREAAYADPRREFEVCPTCRGRGSHVNPSIDAHGITRSEMEELGDEFREAYFEGRYDVTCAECGGRRVVPVLTEEEREEERDRYELAAEVEAERRFGA